MDSLSYRGREMNDFDSKIVALEIEREPLFEEREKITQQIVKINKKIEKLRDQKEKQQMQKPMTTAQEIEYFLFEDGRVSGKRYEARSKFWESKGLYSSGYFPDTEQVNLQLMLYKGKGDNLEQTIKSVEEVLPFIKANDQGVKRLDVFEHTCSEHGSYNVEITDNSYDLVVHRWHRKSTEKSFDNLRSLVEYVQEHHYYESSVDSNSEYDDEE